MNVTPKVPSNRIRELVAEYVQSRDMGVQSQSHGRNYFYSAREAVAEEFGISLPALDQFITGQRHPEVMPFDMADNMLSKMDLVYLWWSELSDIYYAADLKDNPKLAEQREKARERDRRRRAAMTPEEREARRKRQRRDQRARYARRKPVAA